MPTAPREARTAPPVETPSSSPGDRATSTPTEPERTGAPSTDPVRPSGAPAVAPLQRPPAPTSEPHDSTDLRSRIEQTASAVFGWDELHPDQLRAMEQVLVGHDVLAVLPTGAGKSAIYQVPTLLTDGPTVVVSPLLALQRDQIEGLARTNAPSAVAVTRRSGPPSGTRRGPPYGTAAPATSSCPPSSWPATT